jgi:hypothetical protein
MAKDEKPKTESGTPAGTGKTTGGGIDLAKLMEQYATMGGNVQKGPVFTNQDAEAYVQSIYQQILGRNAVGAERSKAINLFLNQSKDTDVSGRQQAVMAMVEETPEFIKRQENRYLDAIYNEVLRDVGRAKA